MEVTLTTFTLLWAVGCVILYFGAKTRFERAARELDEAMRIRQEAEQLLADAKVKNKQAQDDWQKAIDALKSVQKGLMSDN